MDKYTLYPIYGLYHNFFGLSIISWIYLLISVILVIGGIAFCVWHVYKKTYVSPNKQKIKQLLTQLYTISACADEFDAAYQAYESLFRVIREYISWRYASDVHQFTPAELLQFLKKYHVSTGIYRDLEHVIQESTLVRFSKTIVNKAYVLSCKDIMQTYILETYTDE